MASIKLFTFKDAIDHVLDFLGGDAGEQAFRIARGAVLTAYRGLVSDHNWTYLYQLGRLATNASQTTGTIAYDHTGGSSERLVTLTGSTWPSWAALGSLQIGDVTYQIAERLSDTTITLSVNSNPGADVAAATTYRLFRDTYPLPVDCLAADKMLNVSQSDWLWYVHPREIVERMEINLTVGVPVVFAITADPNYVGAMAVRFYPPPDSIYQLDFLYKRRPRPLLVDDYHDGTVSSTAGLTTITGSGTSWGQKHVGCVLRVSETASDLPTGLTGLNPAVEERTVLSVQSSTSLTVDLAMVNTLSGVKYQLSDPVDVEEASMLSPFLRGCEKEVAFTRRMEERDKIAQEYWRELKRGAQADSRHLGQRASGDQAGNLRRLRDYPAGADLG